MKTFDLLITFNKRLLQLILLSLIHAGKRQIICKEYYRTKLVPSFPMFLPSELCLAVTSEHETAVAISFQGMSQRFEFVNFKDNLSCAFVMRVLLFGQAGVFLCQRCCFSRQSWKIYLWNPFIGQLWQLWENPSKQDSPSLQHCAKKFIFELCFKNSEPECRIKW
mgnify:CR=1 FL=1